MLTARIKAQAGIRAIICFNHTYPFTPIPLMVSMANHKTKAIASNLKSHQREASPKKDRGTENAQRKTKINARN
ncbi:MAG: hypothetical protein WCL27_00910 [Betaproteobacteria bacterium]